MSYLDTVSPVYCHEEGQRPLVAYAKTWLSPLGRCWRVVLVDMSMGTDPGYPVERGIGYRPEVLTSPHFAASEMHKVCGWWPDTRDLYPAKEVA